MHALARSRRAARDGSCSRPLGGSSAKWTNVVWPIKSRQTNTHCSFIGIDLQRQPFIGVADVHTVQRLPAVDLYTRASACTSTMSCMWDMLWSRSNCSASPIMYRRCTWDVLSRMFTGPNVHTSKHSCDIYKRLHHFLCKHNHVGCAIPTANNCKKFAQWGKLLFPSQVFVVWQRIKILVKSSPRSKNLQPGGMPNSFAFCNTGHFLSFFLFLTIYTAL